MLARLEVNLPPPHRLPSVRLCLGSKHPNILSHLRTLSLSTPTYTNLYAPVPWIPRLLSLFAYHCQRQEFQSNLMHLPNHPQQVIQFLCLFVQYMAHTELCDDFFFQWVIYALLLIWETISHFGLFLALTFNCEFALLCFNLKLSRCWREGGVSTILFHIELDTWRGVMKETLLWNTTGIRAISVRKGGGNLYHLCDIFFRTS